jgi:hypothetical protein
MCLINDWIFKPLSNLSHKTNVFLDNTLYLFLSQFHGWRAFEAVVS